VIVAFCIGRSDTLPRIASIATPSAARGTRKAFTWPSAVSRAKTAITSACAAPPIQCLAPSMTHSSSSRRAVVDRPPAMSLPWSGSVSANTPVRAKVRTSGSSSATCSGEPPSFTAVRKSPDWAL
jgi:hypothetical protein